MGKFEAMRWGEIEGSTTVWRYMPFDRFQLMLTHRALWFSRQSDFRDAFEGHSPTIPRASDVRIFPQDGLVNRDGGPVPAFSTRNETDGRELTMVSSWVAADNEAAHMWSSYAIEDGIAIRSQVRELCESLSIRTELSKIGHVRYVSYGAFNGMSRHEEGQAQVRAFYKDLRYAEEREVRLVTMNFVHSGALNEDGSPPNESQRAGIMFTPGRKGLYIRANLGLLVHEVRVAPQCAAGFRARVAAACAAHGVFAPCRESTLTTARESA